MFARILEITPKVEKKEEFIKTVRQEILPILKKQPGFVELLAFDPEVKNERFVTITLWNERVDVDRYVKDAFPKVEQIVKPYLSKPIEVRMFNVEKRLCEHFVEALMAA